MVNGVGAARNSVIWARFRNFLRVLDSSSVPCQTSLVFSISSSC